MGDTGRNSLHGQYSSYHQANFAIDLPARVYVHASKTIDIDVPIEMIDLIDSVLPLEDRKVFWRLDDEDGWDPMLGAIIGEVDITACVKESRSPWADPGQYQFVLANPVLYDKPIPYRGQLGFFEVKL